MTPSPATLLLEHLSVESLGDGFVAVTVSLPADLLREYCHFLESLSGFFNVAHRHSTWALSQQRQSSLASEREVKASIDEYRNRLIALFDEHTLRGLDRKSAIKQVAADLRAESHPWCCVELVRSELVAAGRGGRPGRPRRGVK